MITFLPFTELQISWPLELAWVPSQGQATPPCPCAQGPFVSWREGGRQFKCSELEGGVEGGAKDLASAWGNDLPSLMEAFCVQLGSSSLQEMEAIFSHPITRADRCLALGDGMQWRHYCAWSLASRAPCGCLSKARTHGAVTARAPARLSRLRPHPGQSPARIPGVDSLLTRDPCRSVKEPSRDKKKHPAEPGLNC